MRNSDTGPASLSQQAFGTDGPGPDGWRSHWRSGDWEAKNPAQRTNTDPTMQNPVSLEIFQSFTVDGTPEVLAAFRVAIMERIAAPWRALAPEEINETFGLDDFLVFERAGAPDDQVRLSLYRTTGAYEVANVVPTTGQLSRSQYNAIVAGFAQTYAAPAAEASGADFSLGSSVITLEESLGSPGAAALRSLSAGANRSNAASHPNDQTRLYDAILALKGQQIETGTLTRILICLEWPEEIAEEIASQIDFGVGLLAREHNL